MRCNSRAGLHHVFANAPPRPALVSATAHAELLNLSSNLAARIALIAGGKVPWTLGLLMALSSVLGGQLCAHLALRAGARDPAAAAGRGVAAHHHAAVGPGQSRARAVLVLF